MNFLLGSTDRPPPSPSSNPLAAAVTDTTPLPSGMPPDPTRPTSSQNNHGSGSREAPQFSPFGQEGQRHPRSSGALDLAPLTLGTLYASPVPSQQPLPPLRLLNRGVGPPAGPTLPSLPPPPPPLPLSSSTARQPGSDLPFGHRAPRRRASALNSVISTLDEIGHNLDDANSHLRALLDMPSPPSTHELLVGHLPPEYSLALPRAMSSRPGGGAGSRRESSRSEESGRMSKRRKLDPDKAGPLAFKGFRYGRFGQVEPGPLTMEIVSCDGGLYSDGTSYAAENILKNDNSVYCTKGNRCNIVLQHQGCTTFSLKELIIKAPGRNYSSPVRVGMVFLSMSKDELLRTEQYHSNIQPQPAPASSGPRRDALRSYALARITAQRLADVASGFHDHDENADDGGHDDLHHYDDELYNFVLNDPDNEPSTAPANLTLVHPTTFYVETECSDDEDDEAAGRSSRDRDGRGGGWRGTAGWSPTPPRNRPRRRMPLYDESSPFGAHLITWDVDHDYEDDEDDDYTELYDLGDATLSSPDSPRNDGDGPGGGRARGDRGRDRGRDRGGHDRERGEAHPSSSLTGAPSFENGSSHGTANGHGHGSSNNNDGSNGQNSNDAPAMGPNAEFHIEKNKNKCTIHFDPPVTARYILLKMWNPRQDMAGNIDIQGVVAKGFAGPRYFPALELR